jgi:hypothetical protein
MSWDTVDIEHNGRITSFDVETYSGGTWSNNPCEDDSYCDVVTIEIEDVDVTKFVSNELFGKITGKLFN